MPDLLALTNGNAPTAPSPFPLRPKKRFQIDPDAVVTHALAWMQSIENDIDRGEWLHGRLNRYAKYRGWTPPKTYPWAGCSNISLPLLMANELRANAGLHNVVMSLRPLLGARAQQRAGMTKEQTITRLIDAQLFLEPGPEIAERRISDFIAGGLQDGNGVAFTPWIRQDDTILKVHHIAPPPADLAPSDYLTQEFKRLFPGMVDGGVELDGTLDYRFWVTYAEPGTTTTREARIDVFREEDDDKRVSGLVLEIRRDVTVYDGPIMHTLPISAVLVPTRCVNLQPPSDWNPTGAGTVGLLFEYTLDQVKRAQARGEFNYLDGKGLEAIEAEARARGGLLNITGASAHEQMEAQKDTLEGREHRTATADAEQETGHLPVSMLMLFDRYDVDGDGFAEDVVWMIDPHAKVLCEGRYLTEKWPADRPYRPLAEWCPFPVKGRWYGISILELGEAMSDLIKGTFDQAFDSWTAATLPGFFYNASSKLNADVIDWAPLQGIPVPGNPRDTVYWPQIGNQGNLQGGLGIIGLAMQFLDNVMMQGSLQRGQVPTGKASALRTFATTNAILQQGDVRADQLLLRFFNGLSQVARNFHRMNRHLLPPGKEVRLVGWDGPQEQAYTVIQSIDDIDADANFDFRPEFLHSNPEVLAESVQMAMTMLMQPLALQMGFTDMTLLGNLVRDYVKALRLDPKRYLKPSNPSGVPMLLAEEAIGLVLAHQPVMGAPMEGAQAHREKLMEFYGSDQFGYLDLTQVGFFRVWLEQVSQLAQQEQHAQALQHYQQAIRQPQPGGASAPAGQGQLQPAGQGEGPASADALAATATGVAM